MSKKCQKCGAKVADSMNFCPQCHEKVEANVIEPQSAAVAQPPKNSKKSIVSIIGIIIFLLGIAYSWAYPTLLRKARCESLEKILVREAEFKKGYVMVRHLTGLRFGVWVALSDGIFVDKKPAFCMVLNENTNKWEFPTEEDRKKARIYKRVSHGDIDALLE